MHVTDQKGFTALHFSAHAGSYELVKYFVDKGTDIFLKSENEMNCLHIAALAGHLKLCKTLINEYRFHVHETDKNGLAALHYSAQVGNYDLVKYFADKGKDIFLETKVGRNCLHIAAYNGHLDLCKIFINKHNFKVNMVDNLGFTALHCSAQSGNYGLVKFFADKGTDIHLKTELGNNCLHFAALDGNLDLCKALINKHNFDINTSDYKGLTSLHFCVQSGNFDLFNFLIRAGAEVYQKTNNGENCLHIASLSGHLQLCKRLINKHNFDVNVTDNKGFTVLHCSAKKGSYELIKFFTDKGADIHLKTFTGHNCLHIAALSGHFNLCKELINEQKFDVNIADNDGLTALHCSAVSGRYELIKFFRDETNDILLKTKNGKNCLHLAAFSGHIDLCNTLINELNFDLNMADNEGFTALHYSVLNGSYELLKFFLDQGSDILLKTEIGMNCLHIAAQKGYLNFCKALINEFNFDVNIFDNEGWTSIHYSALNGSYELLKFFLDQGCDIFLKTETGKNCLHIAACNGHLNLCKMLISKHNFDIYMTDKNGWTSLHYSAQNDSYELVNFFVDQGSNIFLKTERGMNCLHIAALEGHLKLCKLLINKHNFDIHMTDKDGWTSLHYSAQNGSSELVNFFVDQGSDIFLKTEGGINCLHIAALTGNLNLCNILINEYKFDMHVTDQKGFTALHFSAHAGSYELVKYFVDKGTDIFLKSENEMNCLHIAALAGHLKLCKTLINEYRFHVHETDKNGLAALHYSAQVGNYDLVKYFADKGKDIFLETKVGMNCLQIAAYKGDLNLCKTLTNNHNFKVNKVDNWGYTALHRSVQSGNYELFKFFADKGADIHLKTQLGNNCLHFAAFIGDLDFCKALINKHNFDVNMSDYDGLTSLHFCVQSGSSESFHFLIGKGADVYSKTNNGKNCLHIASFNGHLHLCKIFLNEYKFDIHARDHSEWTPLHFSASHGSFEVFSYLLKKGSEIYCKTKGMKNVLHLSAENGHFDICEFIFESFKKDYDDNSRKDQYELYGKTYESQIFYKYNTIFLHAMDTDGNTYLHLAANGNQPKVCEIILKFDSEAISLLNKKDESARDIAEKNGYKDVLNALKVHYDRAGMFNLFSFP